MKTFLVGLVATAVLAAASVVIYQGAQVSTVEKSAGRAVHVDSPADQN
jgi:hypothetical protein